MLLFKRFLRLVTLASEIALWLGVALSFLLLNTGIQYGEYNYFFRDYLTQRAVSDGCVRFMALSFVTMFFSILVRLCFPNRREVIPAVIRFVLYLILIGFVGSRTISSSSCSIANGTNSYFIASHPRE